MKSLLIILSISCLFASCSQGNAEKRALGKGNYKGNVYWQYNKYVGNRPDAGADVILYSMSDTSKFYITKADVRGDFAFDSIPEGLYFSIVQSKNTTGSPRDFFNELKLNSKTLGQITGYDFDKLISEKQALIHNLDSLKSNALDIKGMTGIKLYDKYRDSINSVCGSLIRQLPDSVRWKILILTPYSSKVSYDVIMISPNKTESKVIDFGITYM